MSLVKAIPKKSKEERKEPMSLVSGVFHREVLSGTSQLR